MHEEKPVLQPNLEQPAAIQRQPFVEMIDTDEIGVKHNEAPTPLEMAAKAQEISYLLTETRRVFLDNQRRAA